VVVLASRALTPEDTWETLAPGSLLVASGGRVLDVNG
jgi:hypothetical protein